MKIVYTGEKAPRAYRKSIFLAGPTPRSQRILRKLKYDGVVFLPEWRSKPKNTGGNSQEEWEHKYLDAADVIVFWVPRDLKKLPGLTTNVEFGLYANSGRVVLGAPQNAKKIDYLKFVAEKLFIPYFPTLEETLAKAVEIIGEGALRRGGERDIPLILWKSQSFQKWYSAQKTAGNKLKELKLVSIFYKVGPQKNFPWGIAIRPSIWIAKEKRLKHNDPVVFRPDISSVVLVKKEKDFLKSKIVLVKEFRNAASTDDGFIHELPSGSSWNNISPKKDALNELEEETDFQLDPKRLKVLGSRQLAGTFSAHKAHVYFAEITEEELRWFSERAGKLKINDTDPTGERLYIEIKTVEEILKDNLVDWSNVGMVLSSLYK